ncbi:MAG: hypothetical protein ACI865_000041 [Flavobacteriaceae bacterium]|jgi:hypothetical protein
MELENYATELEKHIENYEVINTGVSAKSIGWHIDHVLRVNNSVSKAMKESDPSKYSYSFNLTRSYIFTRNSIPRGRARAPKAVVATEKIEKSELLRRLKDNRAYMQSLSSLPPKSNFKHPYFGVLNLKQTIKFMRIHTEHHLKIMRDILK